MTLLTPTEVNISSCAPSGLAASLARGQAEQLASLLKAVADPTRLQLIAYINASSKSESCVCDLTEALDLSQPTISHHLRILTEAGLITREKRGTWCGTRSIKIAGMSSLTFSVLKVSQTVTSLTAVAKGESWLFAYLNQHCVATPGVCGTDVDENLVNFTADLQFLKGQSVDIEAPQHGE